MFGTFAFSTAATIFSPSGPVIDSGFSQRIILPALAAAVAISAWVLLGVQISIRSMSLRSMSLRQSVSVDSYPHLAAKGFTLSALRAQAALRTGLYSRSKKLLTLR